MISGLPHGLASEAMSDAELDVGLRALATNASKGRGKPAAPPGSVCRNDRGEEHLLASPEGDHELQAVLTWFHSHPDLPQLIGDAVEDAIYYVLDGARTHRFDLLDDRVDSDERRSVGTKLQYHVVDNLELPKLRHPDTEIVGIGVEIKGTIGRNWTIPKEGQCGLTLLIRADLQGDRHTAWLMRTHRAWLNDGANNDGKRGIGASALGQYAVVLYPWTDLRPNPLKRLTEQQCADVFSDKGQEVRLAHLFDALPGVVIPRAVILTVCAGRHDPMRRARAVRERVCPGGLALLCGKWSAQRELGRRLGHDLTGAAEMKLNGEWAGDSFPAERSAAGIGVVVWG